MFLHLSVILLTGGVHAWLLPGGHAWLLLGGHAWLLPGGVACMVAPGGVCVVALGGMCGCSGGGGMHGCSGGECVVVPGGVRGCSRGACVIALRGHVWLLRGRAWFLLGGMRGFCQGGVHRIRRDTVNERAVRILLECILVLANIFNSESSSDLGLKGHNFLFSHLILSIVHNDQDYLVVPLSYSDNV